MVTNSNFLLTMSINCQEIRLWEYKKMITKEKMPWCFFKFSQLIPKGNVWRSVWRICMWILGLKGLFNLQCSHYEHLTPHQSHLPSDFLKKILLGKTLAPPSLNSKWPLIRWVWISLFGLEEMFLELFTYLLFSKIICSLIYIRNP